MSNNLLVSCVNKTTLIYFINLYENNTYIIRIKAGCLLYISFYLYPHPAYCQKARHSRCARLRSGAGIRKLIN